MNRLKISIIIPAWHEEEEIAKTLSSLKKSNYPLKECEVIVVASSDDNTYSAAKSQKMNGFYEYTVLKQEPGGKNSALQQGITRSKGEIIIFLDADTRVDRYWLLELVKPLNSRDHICTNGNFFPLTDSCLNNYFMIEKIWSRQIMRQSSTQGKGGIAVKREVFEKIGTNVLLNKKVFAGTDHYFGEQLLKRGYKIFFAEKAKTRTYLNKTLRGFIKDNLRWKRGYFDITSKRRIFAIALFNLAVISSFILFILAFIPSNSFLFSLPFFLYLICIFSQCAAVAETASKIDLLFYFPVYLSLNLIDRLLTFYVTLGKIFGFNKKYIHFKGERT